ncbi:MAG TPA: HD domain-containing phosphohydrolase [Anaeromyxobacteraceae bacterium]|nr:HD domain-containing phosphohydrolase [Anaeromyxobacteraceae bacterium]
MRLFRTFLALTLVASLLPTALAALLLYGERGRLPAWTAVAFGFAIVLAFAVSGYVARRVTAPLRECVRGALEIARGRFGSQVDVTVRNEIGDLAYTFNHMSRELAAYDGENRRLIAALERGYVDTIRSLASAIDAKDPYTRGHSERVAALAVEIGRELRLPAAELHALEYGGILHDIGKIGVPERVLQKRAQLDPSETALVRAHPTIGAEIVGGVEFLRGALPAIRSHHERWDGAGYPDRLAGEAIPKIARVINAADTWDACSSDRPYQEKMTPPQVLGIIGALRGRQIDPEVHDALVRVINRRSPLEENLPHPARGA